MGGSSAASFELDVRRSIVAKVIADIDYRWIRKRVLGKPQIGGSTQEERALVAPPP